MLVFWSLGVFKTKICCSTMSLVLGLCLHHVVSRVFLLDKAKIGPPLSPVHFLHPEVEEHLSSQGTLAMLDVTITIIQKNICPSLPLWCSFYSLGTMIQMAATWNSLRCLMTQEKLSGNMIFQSFEEHRLHSTQHST